MISLTIDGKQVKVEEGATVLESAQQAGIYIPTLCYHPYLAPYGACRLCIVEIEGIPGFPTSCTMPASDGMVVKTNTPQLQQLRQDILELILTEHPNVIHSQNGQSQLQKVAEYIGIKEITLPYIYKELPIEEDLLFERDYNLCILCGRCVQMCQEVRGVGAISFIYRGSQVIVGTLFNRPLKDSGCTFCGACVEVCPTGALMDKEAKQKPGLDREAIVIPCKYACPAGIDVPRYVSLIGEARFAEALAVIRERVPLPRVLGQVCLHPCEDACHRGRLNEPIAIRALKRFAAEYSDGQWQQHSKILPPTGKSVAIVGSGPGGLTAAYYLAKLGHSVTVFEQFPKPGGMMRVGIPDYRLPKDALDAEVEEIKNVGVDIKTNTRIESIDELFQQGYSAIFLALGAHRGTRLGVEGEDFPGVIEGVTLLREVSLDQRVNLGDRVAVIGGGNVATDSARTALRLGAKEVTIVYRRSRAEMPASSEEIEEAIGEGVKIIFLAAPQRISRVNGKLSLNCIRMKLGEPDASGRRRPIPIKGSGFSMDFDTIITAIGQTPDIPSQFSLATGRGNTLQVDSDTLASNKQGVFAGGDVVTGPASVIEAIAAGRRAAISIDRYLGGNGDIDEVLVQKRQFNPYLGRDGNFVDRVRVQMPCLAIEQRIGNFAEVELGLDEQAAVEEAKRCLQCAFRLQIPSAPLPPARATATVGTDEPPPL